MFVYDYGLRKYLWGSADWNVSLWLDAGESYNVAFPPFDDTLGLRNLAVGVWYGWQEGNVLNSMDHEICMGLRPRISGVLLAKGRTGSGNL